MSEHEQADTSQDPLLHDLEVPAEDAGEIAGGARSKNAIAIETLEIAHEGIGPR